MKQTKEKKNLEFLDEIAQQKILGGTASKESLDTVSKISFGNCKKICVPTTHDITTCRPGN